MPVGGVRAPIPERFRAHGADSSRRRHHPEGLLRTSRAQTDEDSWLTNDVVDGFERNVLMKDLQLDSEPEDDETRWEHIVRRRKQGTVVSPDEYNFLTHSEDREKPHELLTKLDPKNFPAYPKPRCDKKKRYHIIPRQHLSAGNLPIMREFVSESGAIVKRRSSGLCMGCQRRLRRVIKRARHLGMVPWNLGWTNVNLLGFPDSDHKSRISKTI